MRGGPRSQAAALISFFSFCTSVLDLSGSAEDKAQPLQSRCSAATALAASGLPLRVVHGCPDVRAAFARVSFEVAMPSRTKCTLYPVYNARALPHQALALAIARLASLFGKSSETRPSVNRPFPQSPDPRTLASATRVEPIGLASAMLPGDTAQLD